MKPNGQNGKSNKDIELLERLYTGSIPLAYRSITDLRQNFYEFA